MGVISAINGHLGEHAECFATFGALCAAYMAMKFTCSVWDGVKTYFLSGPLGLSTNLKKMGEWALVTGATDGIGKAYAEGLAQLGLNIILISRSQDKLDTVASEIRMKYKVKTECIAIDFTASLDIYDSIKQRINGLEIGVLVNNVGITYPYPEFFGEVESGEICKNIVNVNCHSVVMMTYLILPQMVSRRRGVIVNNASGSALSPTPLLTLYSSTKAFVDFFSRGLEQEYKSKGIIVQSLLPFFVSTKMSHMRPSFFVPSAATYVQSALNTIGLQERTFGCAPHAFQAYAFSVVPEWLLRKLKFSALLSGKKRALEKLRRKSQMKKD